MENKMKIRLLQSMAGISFSHNAGDIIDANEAEAKRFVERDIAEYIVNKAPKIERAVKKNKVEKAVKE
jgi:hypothetical protein|tara:strand:- start:2682 stop:2885 length:204 start_codon:yes stop_codon:yes gene_type:complete